MQQRMPAYGRPTEPVAAPRTLVMQPVTVATLSSPAYTSSVIGGGGGYGGYGGYGEVAPTFAGNLQGVPQPYTTVVEPAVAPTFAGGLQGVSQPYYTTAKEPTQAATMGSMLHAAPQTSKYMPSPRDVYMPQSINAHYATAAAPMASGSSSLAAARNSSFAMPCGSYGHTAAVPQSSFYSPYGAPLGMTEPVMQMGFVELVPPMGIPGGFDFRSGPGSGGGGHSLLDNTMNSSGFQFKCYPESGPAYDDNCYGTPTHNEYGAPPPNYRHNEYGMHNEYTGSYARTEVPPPSPPRRMQEADRYEAMAAEHERQAQLLEAQPPTAPVLERQIMELLEGQRALKNELEQVKQTVNLNYNELEVLRQEAQHQAAMPSAPQPYDYYGPPPTMGHPPDASPQGYDHYGPPPPMQDMDMSMQMHQPPATPMGSTMGAPMNSHMGNSMASYGPPRNLGYESTSTAVLETLSSAHATVSKHAATLHGHATRHIKTMTGGGSKTGSSRITKSACF